MEILQFDYVAGLLKEKPMHSVTVYEFVCDNGFRRWIRAIRQQHQFLVQNSIEDFPEPEEQCFWSKLHYRLAAAINRCPDRILKRLKAVFVALRATRDC